MAELGLGALAAGIGDPSGGVVEEDGTRGAAEGVAAGGPAVSGAGGRANQEVGGGMKTQKKGSHDKDREVNSALW